MKPIPTLALLTLAALIAVPAASAQEMALKANIPFQFIVAHTGMPAGDYRITAPQAGILRIENVMTHLAATVVISHGNHDAGNSSKLEFKRWGNQYFLHRIMCPKTTQMNVDVPVWSLERRARSREVRLERVGEQILVAAD